MAATALCLTMAGCMRNAHFEVDSVRRIEPRGDEGIAVSEQSGRVRYYHDYDSVFVGVDDGRSSRQDRYDAPVSVDVSAAGLHVANRERRAFYPRSQVTQLRARRFTPERPLIILSSAAAAAVVAAGLTWLAIEDDCDAEVHWGCYGESLITLAAGTVAFGAGLAISIPLTASLQPDAEGTTITTRSSPQTVANAASAR
jgi:hypothetical protein